MKKLLFNSVFKAILQICNIAIPVIVAMYIIRVLNAEMYATYESVYSYVDIFMLVGTFGISGYGLREFSKVKNDQKKRNQLFTQFFSISLVVNVISFLAFFFFMYFKFAVVPGCEHEFKWACILFLMFFTNVFNVEYIFEADERYSFLSIKSILIKIIYLVLAFVFVRGEADIDTFVIISVTTTVLNLFVSFVYSFKKSRLDFTDFKFFKHFPSLIITLFISSIIIFMVKISKVFLANENKIYDANAIYLANNITQMIYVLVLSLAYVSIPKISRRFARGETERALQTHHDVTNVFCMLLIPALIGLAVVSYEVIDIYTGNKFVNNGEWQTLVLLCVAYGLSGITFIFGDMLLYASGHEKELLVINLIGFVTFLFTVLIMWLSHETSAIYFSIAMIAGMAFVAILEICYVRFKLKLKPRALSKHTIEYFCVSCLFVPISFFIRWIIRNNVETKHQALTILITTILVCFVIYTVLVYVIEAFLFKNHYIKDALRNIKYKMLGKKVPDSDSED